MKHCFIITSAVNSRFGVYSPGERLYQTLATVHSIRAQVPDAKIVLVEMTGVAPTENQVEVLSQAVDVFLDFSDEPTVQKMYTVTDNWDIVKNGTEIMCFEHALKLLKEDGDFEGIDRIHKMSGRYLLTDEFMVDFYSGADVADRIVIGRKHASQFDINTTQQSWQYMSRLWSWPTSRLDEVIDVYATGLAHFKQRVSEGGYIDIEHVLAKFINPAHTIELDTMGIEGTIAPNGVAVKD